MIQGLQQKQEFSSWIYVWLCQYCTVTVMNMQEIHSHFVSLEGGVVGLLVWYATHTDSTVWSASSFILNHISAQLKIQTLTGNGIMLHLTSSEHTHMEKN